VTKAELTSSPNKQYYSLTPSSCVGILFGR
jgi:hypothetical protein